MSAGSGARRDRRGRKVLAAGGIVWRPRGGTGDAAGPIDSSPIDSSSIEQVPPSLSALVAEFPALADIEFVMVHRPRYDDWSLPKGKAERGESAAQTAAREVEEETGLRCRLDRELVTVRYETARGEDKTVRWWAMTVDSDLGFEPDDEVDERRWVDLAEFDRRCVFPTDREVVHSLAMSGALDHQF